MEEPTHLEINLPEVNLRALSWGNLNSPLVVALHGFPDTALTWRHLGPHLAAAGYRVVAPYTRGYAPSGPARDGRYDVAALAEDAIAIREQLAPGEPALLVGHDWGGITAQALAADPNQPFERVVCLAIPPIWALSAHTQKYPRASLLPLLGQLRKSWYIGFNQLPGLPESFAEPLIRRLWKTWSPGYDATTELPEVMAALATPEHRAAIFGYYRALRRVRTEAWMDRPVIPIRHLHGANDGCFSPALSRNAGSEEIANTGHFLHLEAPAIVNEIILESLRG